MQSNKPFIILEDVCRLGHNKFSAKNAALHRFNPAKIRDVWRKFRNMPN